MGVQGCLLDRDGHGLVFTGFLLLAAEYTSPVLLPLRRGQQSRAEPGQG